MNDLNKAVDEFLDPNEQSLMMTQVADERSLTKDIEPSGVDALLIQLQM